MKFPTAALPLCLSLFTGSVLSAAEDREAMAFFENEIRPLLAENCYSCHGADKQKGGLRLDAMAHILQGGDTGPSLIAGKPEDSLIIEAVQRLDEDFAMPPKEALSDKQQAALEKWVKMGAPWPQSEGEVVAAEETDKFGFTAEDRTWWAIQPLTDPQAPKAAGGWARNEIDHFVAAKLQQTNLEPAPEADREELVRRAYFDLHGVPPTPEQVEAFVKDTSPDAWEKLIDELLASPRYGERWGQHWLDVVRFAESDGYRQDAFRSAAWPYRDYVIQSFNEDKPYDQFVKEQLAGDEIAPHDPDVFIGTAYLRNGIYEYNQRNVRMHWELIVDELTRLTGETFLGLGVGCAQCHDHKFDPILQEDYYRMKAFLAPVVWPEGLKLATPEEEAEYAKKLAVWEDATAEIRKEIDAILEPKIQAKMRGNAKMFPDDIKALFELPKSERTPYEQQLVQLAEIQINYERKRFSQAKSVKGEELEKLEKLQAELAAYDGLKPKPLPEAFVAGDVGPKAPEVLLETRNGKTPIDPGYLTILDPSEPVIPEPVNDEHTGRRLALAEWIVNPDNPLGTRVIVNRLWQHHFGAGIVATPNDFGTLGELPSHPQLLDWLTQRFLENDWRMKEVHRLIMNSATYRQTARVNPTQQQLVADPDNRLLWRYPPKRLDAEQARDAMLLVSGELQDSTGGPSVSGNTPRRSVYVKKIRNTPDTMLRGFDAPMGFDSAPTRDATTTALQSLMLVNGSWANARASAFAKRLLGGRTDVNSELVRNAYRWAYGREPESEELEGALAFLKSQVEIVDGTEGQKPAYKFPNENGLRPITQFFDKAEGVELGSSSLWLQPGSRFERLELSGAKLESNDFTIEAVANLDALYSDASVRTLFSKWNGSNNTKGWNFGVTSEKSRYDPRNFILQLIGEDFQGNTVYEVVASDLRVPLNKPVYLAASISTEPTPENKTGGTATFYMKDLSDPKAELQVSKVHHPIVKDLQDTALPLILGGRANNTKSMWDGQLARIALSKGALSQDQLLIGAKPQEVPRLVDLTFDELEGGKPIAGTQWLQEQDSGSSPNSLQMAVTDFCHALLTSNEFLYLH